MKNSKIKARNPTRQVCHADIGQGKVGGGGGRILSRSGKSRKVHVPPKSQ